MFRVGGWGSGLTKLKHHSLFCTFSTIYSFLSLQGSSLLVGGSTLAELVGGVTNGTFGGIDLKSSFLHQIHQDAAVSADGANFFPACMLTFIFFICCYSITDANN